MKRSFLSIALTIVSLCNTIAQEAVSEFDSLFKESLSQLEKKDNHKTIILMDNLLLKYPDAATVYYNRGIAKIRLNDIPGGRLDLGEARKLGFKGKESTINFYTNKQYLVEKLSAPYTDPSTLDSARGYKPIFTQKDSIRGALRPERTCYDVYFYNLTVRILPKTRSIEGSNQIFFKTTSETRVIQVDLTGNYEVRSIMRQGKALTYNRRYDALFIDLGETIPAGRDEDITISYSGKPRVAPTPPWNGGFTWKRERMRWWVGVSCEQLGASNWWPCKDHLSDKPDSMRINVQVPRGYQAVANGKLRSTRQVDSRFTNFEWFVSYPINNYGATFYMGKFVNFTETYTNEGCSFPIDYYVLPQHLKEAREFYSQTKDVMAVYEKLYGPYPYQNDGAGMVEAPFEGMEHQGAIAIGDGYDKSAQRNYENTGYNYLVVHELGHEWWGNTVTMGDMADAWISEGFTTFTEMLFLEEKFGYPAYITQSAKTMSTIFNIWPVVGQRDVNDNAFIGGDIYMKGATTLGNLRCTINNDSLFFSIITTFFNSYKFKIVRTSDFTKLVADMTGKDYSDFFNKFLYDAEPPVLEYSYTQNNDTLAFTYRWTRVGAGFEMPFCITVNDSTNLRLNGTTTGQTFTLPGVASFYLPNERRYKNANLARNAFTYYWTFWKH